MADAVTGTMTALSDTANKPTNQGGSVNWNSLGGTELDGRALTDSGLEGYQGFLQFVGIVAATNTCSGRSAVTIIQEWCKAFMTQPMRGERVYIP